MHKLLKVGFAEHVALTLEEENTILQYLGQKKIKKKEFFTQEGLTAKHVAFVLSGCLRSYSVDENGFEHTLQFAPEGWWITDMHSFISQSKGTLYIEALFATEILVLSRENQLTLFDKVPKLERYFRILTEKSLVSTRQRIIDNLSLPAKKRYANFCKTYPTLIDILPQKQIAAYIGVTPEFLSKMLSKK
jgi:CRP/FNR family transcriptional regulator, anaerobic regulatory protein